MDEPAPGEVTVVEAARMFGVKRDVITRMLRAGELPNSRRATRKGGRPPGQTSPWYVRVDDLTAAGLQVRGPAKPDNDLRYRQACREQASEAADTIGSFLTDARATPGVMTANEDTQLWKAMEMLRRISRRKDRA